MRKLVFLALLHPFIFLFSQADNIVIQWDREGDIPCFPHALYADGENTLPYLTRKIPWPHETMVPVVSVKVSRSTLMSGEGLPPISSKQLKSDPRLEYSVAREAGQSYLLVKILPFFKEENGALARLDEFQLVVEEEPALAPLKSAIKGNWSEHSVLASGNWYRISVEQSGMHRLTYEQLKSLGMQNPASVRVYGSGGRLLPEAFSQGHTDDLSPLPFHVDKGTDGLFGPGDHILFYAEGPESWHFNEASAMYLHQLHTYAWKGYYFLTDGAGTPLAPEDLELSTATPSHTVTSYDFRDFHEDESYNLIGSGRVWYGDLFNINLSENYPFELTDLLPGEALRIRVTAAARSGTSSTFSISANNDPLGTLSVSGTDLSHYTSTYAYESAGVYSYTPDQDAVTVSLTYNRPDANSQGWLNAITVNGRCVLNLMGDELDFRDALSTGPGNISRFRLSNANSNTVIWDITNPSSPMNVPYTLSGSLAEFTLETNDHREFIAFQPGGTFAVPGLTGEMTGLVENQDLHGLDHPEMIIITPEAFLEEATRLAEFRRENDGLDVAVVQQQAIFNEFSSGTPDATAIRNFMKMFYDRSGGSENKCRYLLLLGDGSFDNRGNTDKPNNTNLLLTYQSENSLSPTASYVSDDYFALLDTDESMYNGLLDVGIGRLPVSDLDEAAGLVDKLIGYSNSSRQGEWRNQLCFIGDDEDSNIHMRQADELANNVKELYPGYNINKIYLDAYPQEQLSNGPAYPDVTLAINNQVNRGALIINYTGHGGTLGLAHEKILQINDIFSWTNKEELPLFMTATCEFSRYDDYNHLEDLEETSAGEEVLLSNNGGGIGLFTTTRLVYSGPNHTLNERFYEVVFEKDASQRNYRLGDIIVYSKNNTGAGINKRNFTLLGDPSLRLTYPRHRVVTDSINGSPVSGANDTLSAFRLVRVSGHMESEDGTMMDQFDGTVYPKVFDKEKKVESLANDGGNPFIFDTRENILYSGKTTVNSGKFSFEFYVPKDINYSFGKGKISYYGNNGESDAHGCFEDFIVGGIANENASDNEVPVIELFMNDSFFVSGGITDTRPRLLAYVSDNFGINTTGNGIGHDLIATLDDDRINAVVLNEFYQANTNSYNSGVISYPYSKLEPGLHTVAVKIWDIHNNSAESALEFVVMDSEEMLMDTLFNFPNPFVDQTWFSIEHNRPDSELRLLLSIYNLSGELVRVIDRTIFSTGYRLEPVEWDGTTSGGAEMGGGIYVYRATLSNEAGEFASKSGKLIITH